MCVWEGSNEVNVTFTGLVTSFAKTCLLSIHSVLWSKSLDRISALITIFMRYEMLLIKWIFSFPGPKDSLHLIAKLVLLYGTHCSILDICPFQLELS